METHWTGPVKLALLLSLLCVIGTGIEAWIGWQQLHIMQHPSAVAADQQKEGTVVTSSTQENRLSSTSFVVSSILGAMSVVMLGIIAYIVSRPQSALADDFKKQLESLTKERDTLRAEESRLNQHIKDLMGHQVQTAEQLAATVRKANITSVQPTRQVVPNIGITLRETVVEAYDQTPGRNYPRKLRLYCSNDGDDIHLGVGTWLPDKIGLQSGKASACFYELKDHLGKFANESADKFIASGKWFRLYVGIDSTISDKALYQMKVDRSFGVLEIPAEISGLPVKISLRP
jgi:hypothetical protein